MLIRKWLGVKQQKNSWSEPFLATEDTKTPVSFLSTSFSQEAFRVLWTTRVLTWFYNFLSSKPFCCTAQQVMLLTFIFSSLPQVFKRLLVILLVLLCSCGISSQPTAERTVGRFLSDNKALSDHKLQRFGSNANLQKWQLDTIVWLFKCSYLG